MAKRSKKGSGKDHLVRSLCLQLHISCDDVQAKSHYKRMQEPTRSIHQGEGMKKPRWGQMTWSTVRAFSPSDVECLQEVRMVSHKNLSTSVGFPKKRPSAPPFSCFSRF